jgi:hypothetical protein
VTLLMDNAHRKPVNWTLIGRAIEFYKMRGYTYIEVPWAISREDIMATCPTADHIMQIDGEDCLVGSAEQSLISLDLMEHLENYEKYVACTPCWRKEPVYDDYHHGTFMKVELYMPVATGSGLIGDLLYDAKDFLQSCSIANQCRKDHGRK